MAAALKTALLLAVTTGASSFVVSRVPYLPRPERACRAASSTNIQMINLFGNNDESKKQRDALSLRSARPGDRKVTFRKPNSATQGLMLGLKFRESFGKAVYIDGIVPGSEAARLEQQGKIKKGDEVTMISATFGDEMWSARNVGKYRLEKSIAVRQGMTISFVFENSDDNSKRARQAAAEKAKKENQRISRLQAEVPSVASCSIRTASHDALHTISLVAHGFRAVAPLILCQAHARSLLKRWMMTRRRGPSSAFSRNARNCGMRPNTLFQTINQVLESLGRILQTFTVRTGSCMYLDLHRPMKGNGQTLPPCRSLQSVCERLGMSDNNSQ